MILKKLHKEYKTFIVTRAKLMVAQNLLGAYITIKLLSLQKESVHM